MLYRMESRIEAWPNEIVFSPSVLLSISSGTYVIVWRANHMVLSLHCSPYTELQCMTHSRDHGSLQDPTQWERAYSTFTSISLSFTSFTWPEHHFFSEFEYPTYCMYEPVTSVRYAACTNAQRNTQECTYYLMLWSESNKLRIRNPVFPVGRTYQAGHTSTGSPTVHSWNQRNVLCQLVILVQHFHKSILQSM